jgi:hypothetical protein
MNREITQFLAFLDQAYDKRSWHGPNLRGSLRGLDLPELSFRPGPDRHDIWEIAVHAAYWKYAVLRRITGERHGSFPLKGSNWFARPVPGGGTAAAFRADLALLDEMHARLRGAVASLPPRRLGETPRGSRFVLGELVSGAAAHDLYHAGQVQLLKRMFRSAG